MSFFVIYIFAIKDWNKRMLHYVIALFPLMSVFAAGMLNDLAIFLSSHSKRFSKRFLAGALLTVACLIPGIINVVEIYGKLHISTREMAREWIEANIDSGSKIAIDDFHTGVPLLGKSHFLLYETPATREEVDKIMPLEIARRYADWVKGQKHYDIYSIVLVKNFPEWPSDMPGGILDNIDLEQKKYLDHVASHWHFMPVSEMKKRGIKFVVLNSVAYTSFLPDGHPRKLKWFCFENFPREDFPSITIVPPFNPDMPGISNVSKARMFIYRRAHQFYDSFWSDKDIRLIKEFRPSPRNLGPIIEIYEINYDTKR
jgi:hypothetical protein